MNFNENVLENIDYYFSNLKRNDIEELSDIILNYKENNIYALGIGKSYNIALHLVDLLCCINFSAFTLNSSNMLHGNIGCIKHSKSLVFIISNSGNTFEFVNIINQIKEKKESYIILLSSKRGILSNMVDKNVIIPIKNELEGCFSLIPTNSIMINIIFVNNLIEYLIKECNLKKKTYLENHLLGDIGILNKKVKNCLIDYQDCCILNINNTYLELIKEMNIKKIGVAVIKNDISEKIEGIITSRDILNYLENNQNINISTIKLNNLINKKFFYLDDIEIYIKNIIKKYNYIPIIKNSKLLGVCDLTYNYEK